MHWGINNKLSCIIWQVWHTDTLFVITFSKLFSKVSQTPSVQAVCGILRKMKHIILKMLKSYKINETIWKEHFFFLIELNSKFNLTWHLQQIKADFLGYLFKITKWIN